MQREWQGRLCKQQWLPCIYHICKCESCKKTGLGEENNMDKEKTCRDWDTFYTATLSFYSVSIWCPPVFTYQATCTWHFRQLWTQESTDSGFLSEAREGLEQEYMLVLPIFLSFQMRDCQKLSLCLHMVWLLSSGQKSLSLPLWVVAPRETELRTQAAASIMFIRYTEVPYAKKHRFIKMHMT